MTEPLSNTMAASSIPRSWWVCHRRSWVAAGIFPSRYLFAGIFPSCWDFSYLLPIPSYFWWLVVVCLPSLVTISESSMHFIPTPPQMLNRSHPLSPQNRAGEHQACVELGGTQLSNNLEQEAVYALFPQSLLHLGILPYAPPHPPQFLQRLLRGGRDGDSSPNHVFPPQTTRAPDP